MSGTKPRFMKKVNVDAQYYKEPDPYVNGPVCPVNLLELSRYARKQGKKLADLTQEEVKKFSL